MLVEVQSLHGCLRHIASNPIPNHIRAAFCVSNATSNMVTMASQEASAGKSIN